MDTSPPFVHGTATKGDDTSIPRARGHSCQQQKGGSRLHQLSALNKSSGRRKNVNRGLGESHELLTLPSIMCVYIYIQTCKYGMFQ